MFKISFGTQVIIVDKSIYYLSGYLRAVAYYIRQFFYDKVWLVS